MMIHGIGHSAENKKNNSPKFGALLKAPDFDVEALARFCAKKSPMWVDRVEETFNNIALRQEGNEAYDVLLDFKDNVFKAFVTSKGSDETVASFRTFPFFAGLETVLEKASRLASSLDEKFKTVSRALGRLKTAEIAEKVD